MILTLEERVEWWNRHNPFGSKIILSKKENYNTSLTDDEWLHIQHRDLSGMGVPTEINTKRLIYS